MTLIFPELDESTGKYSCPENYIICGPDEYLQSHYKTVICLRDASECPITSITFTEEADVVQETSDSNTTLSESDVVSVQNTTSTVEDQIDA